MGLFNKSSHPSSSSSSSTWAIIPSSDEIMHPCQDSRKMRDFFNLSTSQESIVMDKATVSSTPSTKYSYNSSSDDVNTSSQKLQLLERQLQQKDAAIYQLCQTMEASEKVQSERIYLLERQLEQLVELSSSECAAYQGCKTSSPLLNLPKKSNDSHHRGTKEHQEAKIEISLLQDLLARVVAEKDRLIMTNGNLKSLLEGRHTSGKDCYSSSSESSNMPSSIKELDILIHHTERKTKCRGDINNRQQDQHIGSIDQNLLEEKLVCEEYMHVKEEASKRLVEDKALTEKARREREKKEMLLLEEKVRKEEKKARKEKKRLEHQRKEEELPRVRYEAEMRECEEAARREFEREKLEREKAKHERLEQQQKALEEKQRAKRAERLKQMRAEQEQVEMQVKKFTEHPVSGRVSKKHSTATKTKPLNGKAKALVQKNSIGSEPTTPRQSKLSAAVSQVAKERSPQRAIPNGSKRNSSRLSLAVAAAAQQRSTTTPQKTPVTLSTPKLANPAVVDAKMEIMNWLQNKK